MPKRILIINPFGVGDVLFSTPLISAVRKKDPLSYIAYICNIRTRETLETNPDINEVLVFERSEYRALWAKSKLACIKKLLGFWGGVRKRKFDIVIDLSLGKEYAFLCWVSGIKERRGFNYKGRGRFLTHKVRFDGFNDKPVAEYYLDVLSSRLRPPLADKLEQYSSSEVEKNIVKAVLIPLKEDSEYIDNFLKASVVSDTSVLIGISPGGGMSFGKKNQSRRRWGAEKFSELADRLAEKFKATIILIWGPGEEDLVAEIAGRMKQKALIAPQTTIRQMAALCGRCSLVICSEGGPLHIAASQGVKTVSIFGPVDENVYGPYPKSEKNIIVTSNISCRPCYKKFKLPECETKKCLEDITVETVETRIGQCGFGI
ncbi:MAG: glycosyltransferase family 9 protein [Candidatus Omnitrophica bacterium]|nr:glycosyltransferase family 9 protein [Candidatus Omnitrophota bacterium]